MNKNILPYRSFKTTDELVASAKEDIEESLIDLKDMGHGVNVSLLYEYGWHMFVRIIDNDPHTCTRHSGVAYQEIKDDLYRVIEISKMYSFRPITVFYKKIEKDGRIFNKHLRDNLDMEEWIRYTNLFEHEILNLSYLSIEFEKFNDKVYEGNVEKVSTHRGKRKRIKIRKISDKNYTWNPNFDRRSPDPTSTYQVGITPIKL